jgi:ATP-dependent DNA helicase DinG
MPGMDRIRAAHRSRRVENTRAVDAFVSFLARHGYPPPIPEQEITEEMIVSRIADGPIPPAYLAVLAERCGFGGSALIAGAMSCAAEGRRAAGERPASEARATRAAVRGIDLEEAFSLVFGSLGEVRDGQLEMARAVWRALDTNGVALLEAGTGTGKSLAYLVPSVLHSFRTGERIVVSTYTKNLQDQLFRKEMGILEEALAIDARAERLLGRDNYLCTRNVIVNASRLAEATSAPALAMALAVTLSESPTIDSLSALPDGVDAASLAAPQRCPMNACGFADRCPLIRARVRAREARILFVNHALLLTDYRQGGSVLGPYARVVFDEAHHLERCIIENLSVKASREDIFRLLEPLRLFGREDDAWRLLVHELEGVLSAASRKGLRKKLSRMAKDLEEAYGALFSGIADSLNADRSLRSMKTRYSDGRATFAEVGDGFSDILFNINSFAEALKVLDEVKLKPDLTAFQQEIGYAREELATLSESLRYLSTGQDEGSVFWLDWDRDGSLREICGSPLAVDRSFADYLDGFLGSAVFTSATLSQNGSFAFIKERLGLKLLAAKPIELIVPSPFPFDENCLVLIVPDLGDPNHEGFAAPVSDVVSGLAGLIGRRTMVLFTSYRLCFAVAAALGKRGVGRPLLVQGAGESREALSARFRRHPDGVLLGVASFWEGVDFPGEELEVLVIPKIPFPVPTEPIVEARAQRLSALGEDPFGGLFLPEAILRMRQGAGRLIRRMGDRGVIVILDSRLGAKPYGSTILSSLPSRNIEHVSLDDCVARAARWFAGT